MKEVNLVDSGTYKLYVAVSGVPTDENLNRVYISSTLSNSAHPNERQKVAEIFVTNDKLSELKSLLP